MKGCLKLNPPSPGRESAVQHLNNLNKNTSGPRCCYPPTTTSFSSTTASASCTTTTDAVSITQNQAQTHTHRKCVAFCAEGSETVYMADEWDRTPTEPARKLSYQDLLELKEIQRSLPHANQPADVVTGRPGKQFLSAVPIVLLPLLSPGASASGEGAQEEETKKPSSHSYFSDVHGRPNGHTKGNGPGWGPPSLTGFGRQPPSTQADGQSQPQTSPVRPSFPFPPRPPSTSNFTSARAPAIPWRMSLQSQNKTGSSSPLSPSSPTSPYPVSYANRSSSTSTSPTSPTTPRAQAQTQPRMPWTPPHSLSHLMPSAPIKPREKPKFEFVTLLDTGAGTGGSGPSPNSVGEANRAENVEATTPKVGHEVLHPISKLPSGLIEVKVKSDRDDKHDMEDHDQDHDLISVTSSSSCPSLCASSCPSSCSTSEVDTDHEHEPEIKTGGKHFSPKRYSGLDPYSCGVGLGAKGWADGNENGAPKFLRTKSIASDSLLLPPPSPLDLDSGSMVKPKRKEKKKKFILVNDMEIELDESESEEEDPVPLSGRFTNTSTITTRETTTTKTTTRTTTEKTTTTTTTVSSNGGSPPSPRSVVAPVPIKSTLGGSLHLPPSSSSASASLITPPTTPPSEQTSRYGNHSNMHNKPLYSPGSSPSAANRGRMKGSQKKGSSTSRERSASMGSDTSGGGGGGDGLSPSPSCTPMRIGSPVKLKSKMS